MFKMLIDNIYIKEEKIREKHGDLKECTLQGEDHKCDNWCDGTFLFKCIEKNIFPFFLLNNTRKMTLYI